MKPRYTGPMIVVQRNKGGSYILAEMDGAVWHQKVARFRVIPYFARERIELSDGIMGILDCDEEVLSGISERTDLDDGLSRDYLMNDVVLKDSDDSDDLELAEEE